MDFDGLLRVMVDQGGSDLFLKVGNRPFLRVNGQLTAGGSELLDEGQILTMTSGLLGPQRQHFLQTDRELNFAFDRPSIGRFRANVLWQRGTPALVIRRVQRAAASFAQLNLPEPVFVRLAGEQHGLVLVTGPTGSGKSTTVAAMLDYLNRTIPKHIVTLEDPIEFQFEECQAIINQREIGVDTRSFSEGLKNVLRQSPDVLFISDIRDTETMESALLAAEAGQLVLSCVHTTNAVTTIERLVAFFPPHQQRLIRLRLSLVLRGVISLRLLPRVNGDGRVPVCEVMVSTPTIRELLREGRTERLPNALREGGMYGMQTFTQALYERYRQGEVQLEEALKHADSPEELRLAVQSIRTSRHV